MAKLEIYQFPTRSDNYGVLIHDPGTGATAAIDAPEAEPIFAALQDKGWMLTEILITHHHADHTAGVETLKKKTGCTVCGPAREAGLIPGLDVEVKESDTVAVGSAKGRVIETPGHTRGHVSYYFPDCSRSAAASCSKAMRRPCGRRCRSSLRCRQRRRSIAATNTPTPIAGSR
jgi:hydroxyacylglutathione hydrolase